MDYLAHLPVATVAAWYRRLADLFANRKVNGEVPYASILLRHWLDNRDPKSVLLIEPRPYLRTSPHVMDVLRYHRAVFLTQKEARFGKPGVFGTPTRRTGVVPRIKGESGFALWKLPGDIDLEYQSLVEVGSGPLDILRIQRHGSPG